MQTDTLNLHTLALCCDFHVSAVKLRFFKDFYCLVGTVLYAQSVKIYAKKAHQHSLIKYHHLSNVILSTE